LERRADATRKKSIDSLKFVRIDNNRLPLDAQCQVPAVAAARDRVLRLSDEKICDLSQYTNTELKLKYGAPNLPELIKYDENFNRLTLALQQWGCELVSLSAYGAAAAVLECAVNCGSQRSESYKQLARCYEETGQNHKLADLIAAAQALPNEAGDRIIKALWNPLAHISQNP